MEALFGNQSHAQIEISRIKDLIVSHCEDTEWGANFLIERLTETKLHCSLRTNGIKIVSWSCLIALQTTFVNGISRECSCDSKLMRAIQLTTCWHVLRPQTNHLPQTHHLPQAHHFCHKGITYHKCVTCPVTNASSTTNLSSTTDVLYTLNITLHPIFCQKCTTCLSTNASLINCTATLLLLLRNTR